MKAWLSYALWSLVVVVVGATVAMLLVAEPSRGAVWFSAGVAYVLQLGAFGALVAVRERSDLFLVGWLAGLVVRFLAVGVVAIWLSRDEVFPREAALVSLVAFVFMLLMLEPLFLRRGLQTQ